jgi:ATP-dependent DNA ligase
MPRKTSALTLKPPIYPMLAKLADALPAGDYSYEPKWDGFRALVFRGKDEVYLQSRDARPLDRYFPDLLTSLNGLPKNCVLDGEIVIATSQGLDFDALQLRLHPSASRVEKLAREAPAAFIAFDLIAVGSRTLLSLPQADRRDELTRLLEGIEPPVYLTPMTRDRKVALDWLRRFEGAGLDGVIAKPAGAAYQPGKRAMVKVKHVRTADCAVAGFRWHKSGAGAVGSLLYNERDVLQHVGVAASFSMTMRRQLAKELAPLRKNAMKGHPWRDWAGATAGTDRMPVHRAGGARARICPGSPCGSRGSAK